MYQGKSFFDSTLLADADAECFASEPGSLRGLDLYRDLFRSIQVVS